MNKLQFATMRSTAVDIDWMTRFWVSENINTPTEKLMILALDEDISIRENVAKHPNTSPVTLKSLATDKYDWVRWFVALNRNTPLEALMIMARDEDWEIRNDIGKHHRATELVRRLVVMTNAHQKS
jgi:hypothetical protein